MNRQSIALWLVAIFGGLAVGCSALTPFAPTPQLFPTLTPVPSPSTSSPTIQATIPPTIPLPTAMRPIATVTVATNPQIISFTVVPTTTFGLSEKIALTWQAKGDKAEICGIIETGPIGCDQVPLTGNKTMTTSANTVSYAQLALRVTSGNNTIFSFVPVLLCRDATKWFFDKSPARCPDKPAEIGRGAAQYFEHGFMIWMDQPDTFYIFYSDGKQTFESASAPYQFKPGAAPNNRVSEVIPRGFVEPISGFGQIWRGEMVGKENVRQRLGWAIAPEFAIETAYQCAVSGAPRLWTCYLKGPRGKVLRLHPDSSAGVNLVWEEL